MIEPPRNKFSAPRPTLWALAVVLGLGAVLPAQAAGVSERLPRELQRLSGIAGGMVGVAAVHLETGREVFINGDEPFPMASTYKVPIATRLLRLVDDGELTLNKMISIEPGDLHPGSGTLSALFDDPGVELSLRNLLELMLLISDNSATDMVLREAGGGVQVTAHMGAIGVEGVRVDRPTLHLIANFSGVSVTDQCHVMTREYYLGERLQDQVMLFLVQQLHLLV